MIAIKDFESLNKLASVLAIPFFSAAYLTDGVPVSIQNQFLEWLKSSSLPLLKIGGWALWLFFVVAIVALVFLLIDQFIIWLHVITGDQVLMPWVGFTFLTAGIFVLGDVFPHLPQSPLNPLWHLGFVAYGLSLVKRGFKDVEKGASPE